MLNEDAHSDQLLRNYFKSLETAEDFNGEKQLFSKMWEYENEYFLPSQATEFLDDHLELEYKEIFDEIDSEKFRKDHPKLKEEFKAYDGAIESQNDEDIDFALEQIFFSPNFITDFEILKLLGATPNN